MLTVTTHLPFVQVLTTGGTIAGAAASGVSASYQSGARRGQELLASVPGLERLARLRVADVVAKDSADLLLEDWQKLYASLCTALADPDIAAVVITHGTDTLEETAFFLDLLLRTDKPVVLVGAMRPATALSADGPLNLLNAVAVAISPHSVGRGVLVVMNDSVMTARAAAKSHTTAVQAFTNPSMDGGMAGIGTVNWGEVRYVVPRGEVSAAERPLPFAGWSEMVVGEFWPRVDILYLHAAMDVPCLVQGMCDQLQGVVLAGVGAGNVPTYLISAIEQWQAQGVVVVRSTRVWAGGVIPDYQGLDSALNLVSAADLSPHKARILLMLALRFSRDVGLIRACFEFVCSEPT